MSRLNNQKSFAKTAEQQASHIYEVMRVSKKRRALLDYLLKAKENGAFASKPTGKQILVQFEVSQGAMFDQSDPIAVKQAYDRARQVAVRLSDILRDYYSGPGLNDGIKVLLPLTDLDPDDSQTYEPQVVIVDKLPKTLERVDLWRVGNNVDALSYVTKQISKLNRIEETFVRWVDRKSSLYEGNAFSEFLKELRGSRLLYRAVLGLMTDSAIFHDQGLRETLANRVSKDLPADERAAKLYRLLHDTALMNFTLLYYFETEDDFYNHTSNVEVLFGYGVHEPFEKADTTVVFRSTDAAIVNEFQELFKALREEEFSRQLDIGRPDLFSSEPRACDVLATFTEVPLKQITRRIKASGMTKFAIGKDIVLPIGVKRDDVYVPRRPHIKICVSALKLLDTKQVQDALRRALDRDVQVSIALWTPASSFVRLRAQAIGVDVAAAIRELEGAWAGVRSLGKHDNLFIRRCGGLVSSLSIIWIDEFIYFSPYWLGKDVADGPHFLVTSDSDTGMELRDQYDQMLATAELEP